MDLPDLKLGESPVRHSDCCLALSEKLLRILTQHCSRTAPPDQASTVLSIGSGTGLLEALWLSYLSEDSSNQLSVEGVEVHTAITRGSNNKYLPEQVFSTVRGTWGLTPRLEDPDVTALLFVYPRQPQLVSRYIEACAKDESGVKTIIWLGPNADWAEFKQCFEIPQGASSSPFRVVAKNGGDEIGIDSYEMMVVLQKGG